MVSTIGHLIAAWVHGFVMRGWMMKNDIEAFPCSEYGNLGMTLRDYFAAKAMAAMLSIGEVHFQNGESEIARWSYDQADAMLEQRKVLPGKEPE
jgi:hypothetical protein